MTETTKDKDGLVKEMLNNIQPKTIFVAAGTANEANILLVPKGMEPFSIKGYLEEFREVPERRKGIHKTDRIDSFIGLTNRFKSANSAVFAKSAMGNLNATSSLFAVLDFHPEGPLNTIALNCEHAVKYDFPVSKEFTFWLKGNATAFTQAEFALILEERIDEMVTADHADIAKIANLSPKFAPPLEILQLSRSLEVYSNEKVLQAVKLSSGERNIKFSAEHVDGDGKPLSIPDFFVLNIPIFEGEDPVRMLVRLRYRKQSDAIVWFYDLYRVDQVFRTAFDKAVAKVAEATGLPVYMGEPASAKK